MKSIYKYTISPFNDKLEINAPIVRFLSAQVQHGSIRIWAEVDTNAPDRHFLFLPIGTGWDLDKIKHFERATYFDTVQEFGGDLVWHLYFLELTEPASKIIGDKLNGTIQ